MVEQVVAQEMEIIQARLQQETVAHHLMVVAVAVVLQMSELMAQTVHLLGVAMVQQVRVVQQVDSLQVAQVVMKPMTQVQVVVV
jgi:hypothetical protein